MIRGKPASGATPVHAPGMMVRLRRLLGEPIPPGALGLFFERLAVLVSAGWPIHSALTSAAPTDDGELAAMCAAAAPAVCEGAPLHRALAPHARRLPPIVLPVLEVGEVSGTLDAAARRLAETLGAMADAERRYRAAAFSPWLAIGALSLYSAIFAFIASPAAGIATGLRTFVTLAAVYLALRFAARSLHYVPGLRAVVDSVRLAVPFTGIVARELAAARWGRSYATLWNAGVPAVQAVEVSARSALNAHYEEALHRAALAVNRGEPISSALARTTLLPPYLAEVVRCAEESGRVGEALERLVAEMERDALSRASRVMITTVTALELLALLIAAGALRLA